MGVIVRIQSRIIQSLTFRKTSPKSARPTSSVPKNFPAPVALPSSFQYRSAAPTFHLFPTDDGQGLYSSPQHTSMRSMPSTVKKAFSQCISWVASPSARPWRRSPVWPLTLVRITRSLRNRSTSRIARMIPVRNLMWRRPKACSPKPIQKTCIRK